ncbi:energy transducer TonB [Arenicella xantha]|uniref:TonB-like protein n=1 Tax=Arenicella xantha TaxID=644221 RepID=A0A395JKD4_9GAMM|nr:energy transducer TonB [Arenicella xantha]RBP51151.1 TonB-like protein [Arenicella xantha]
MQKNIGNVLTLFACLLSTLIAIAVQAQEFVPAKVIESSVSENLYEGIWPSRIDSGVAELVFMVDKTGQPKEIEVLRSSRSFFNGPAIKTIETYRYQPATVNAEPVESRQVARVEFDHSKIANIRGFVNPMDAPDGYMSLYNRLRKELNKESPNHRKAVHTLNKIHRLRYKTFFTEVHTQLARYYLAVEFGSKEEQLEPLLKVMMFENIEWGGKRALDDETKNTIQLAILKLMLDLGHNAEALKKYSEFSATNSDVSNAFSSYMQKIKQIQQSDSVLERRVTLTPDGKAFLSLLKKSFVVELVTGSVDNFLIRCERRFARFEYNPEAQYDIPAAWGECEMQLNGAPDTLVSVLQQ